jgi:hypothetical protein
MGILSQRFLQTVMNLEVSPRILVADRLKELTDLEELSLGGILNSSLPAISLNQADW